MACRLSLMDRAINKHNYFLETYAVFKGCKPPLRDPDYVSPSGSEYWYGTNRKGEYVIRYSDHWCAKHNPSSYSALSWSQCRRVASCRWFLRASDRHTVNLSCREWFAGKAYFSRFKRVQTKDDWRRLDDRMKRGRRKK